MQGLSSRYDKTLILIVSSLSVAGYLYIGYFIPRYHTFELISAYVALFACYLILYFYLNSREGEVWIVLAVLFRLVLLFSIPALSDDFYRFSWDGRLLAAGFNPYVHVPDFYMDSQFAIHGIDISLYKNLNFTAYHSMYPPVAQFTGWLGALLDSNSIFWGVFIQRLFIVLAEIGSILIMRKLAASLNIKSGQVILYALNPLVILELTGNLHHEAFVIFFLMLSILWIKKRPQFGMIEEEKLSDTQKDCLEKIDTVSLRLSHMVDKILVLFLPFINSQLINGFLSSGSLYFQKFEFNASIYYLVREVGFWYKGYNIIQTAGPRLGMLVLVLIILFSWYAWKRRMPEPLAFMWVLVIYVVFATTLHPWYILPILAFSVFTRYKFPVVWSLMIFFTYSGYSANAYSENPLVIAIEYLVVYGVMLYEIFLFPEGRNMFSRSFGKIL